MVAAAGRARYGCHVVILALGGTLESIFLKLQLFYREKFTSPPSRPSSFCMEKEGTPGR